MAIPILGDMWGKVIDGGRALISEFITDKDQAKQLDHAWRTQMEANRADNERAVLEHDTAIFEAQQKTIQAELHQNDQYTKRTRPIIARRSFYAGLGYVVLTSLPIDGLPIPFTDAVLMPWQFQWAVLMLLYSPALTYMGVRGFEKWKNGMVK
jgi:hypothetical protein